jgi:aldehyde:ferredoxin oxidoreductase
MTSARAQGSYIDRAGFDKMLDEYYALRGWDSDGILPEERVAELNSLRGLS